MECKQLFCVRCFAAVVLQECSFCFRENLIVTKVKLCEFNTKHVFVYVNMFFGLNSIYCRVMINVVGNILYFLLLFLMDILFTYLFVSC